MNADNIGDYEFCPTHGNGKKHYWVAETFFEEHVPRLLTEAPPVCETKMIGPPTYRIRIYRILGEEIWKRAKPKKDIDPCGMGFMREISL